MEEIMRAFKELARRMRRVFGVSRSACEHVFTAYKRFDCEEKCYPAKIDFNSVQMLDQVMERKPKNLIKKTNM